MPRPGASNRAPDGLEPSARRASGAATEDLPLPRMGGMSVQVAARRDKSEIGYEEIDYSIDRLTVGMQKTTGKNFPNRQVRTLGAARGPDPHSGPRPPLPPHPALP